MAHSKYIINDPDLTEFIYNCLATATDDQKKKLNAYELQNFKTKRIMKRFAETQPLEKRMLLLAKMGIGHCLVFGDRSTDYTTIFSEIITQSAYAKKRLTIVEAMSRNKLFVVSSKDVLMSAYMAAQNSHSQVYILNRAYVLLQHRLSQLKESVENLELRDAQQGFDDISLMMLKGIASSHNIESICGVDLLQIKILLAMFPYRNTFVSTDKITELTQDSFRGKGVATRCGKLEKKGYIARAPGYQTEKKTAMNKRQEFTIMEKGMDAVAKYIKYVID